MFNLWWALLFVGIIFVSFLLCYRWFGMVGLFAWIGFATLMANIQVVKTIEILGVVTTLGNTMYASVYMSTDLLNEKYGAKQARQAAMLGFFSLIVSTVIMQMVLVFHPQETDFAQSSLETIFGLLPRLAIGSLTAYAVSQLLDVHLFQKLKKRFSSPNQFWIRINGSTLISQFIDSLIFCSIAFAGLFPFQVWIEILITTYLFKFLLSIAGTPILYMARRMKVER